MRHQSLDNTLQGKITSLVKEFIIVYDIHTSSTNLFTVELKLFTGQKFLPNPASYLCVAEIFSGINFCPCGKGHHRLYVFINTRQKKLWDKNFAHESRG